jgi:hypothetical protein
MNAELHSNEGFTVSSSGDLFIDLYKAIRPFLKGASWKNITIPNFYSENQMVKNTLEIGEYVMTEKRKTRQRIMHPCPIRNSLKMPQT